MRIRFTPAEHGFPFANSFTNHVLTIPGLGIDLTTAGRCGGMAAAAMDYWYAGLAMPTDPSLPQDGSLVADYVYSRLMDTFVDNGLTYVHYATSLDHPTWLRGKGVARMTREDELPKLTSRLESGQPVLLGLNQARSVTDLGNDHQVVAYGYEQDARYTYVLVYDNNDPGVEVRLRLTTVDDPGERDIVGSNGQVWRGLFVEAYTRKMPGYLTDGLAIHDSTDPRIHVVRGGGAFWIPSPAEFDAGGFHWDGVLAAKPGSLCHVARHPANGTLVRERGTDPVHVVYGGKAFWIPSPEVFEALGHDWDLIKEVPQGSLGGLRQVPLDHTLLRERSSDPVWLVQGGTLHHVTIPDVMGRLGLEWSCVNVVPDGALAGLPTGAPIS
ncbi:hypothetical protein [Terrabacter sp. NPDC000476]|uniref:hypothetical protein n=1 Tax=Terrabacter sp. NPDC000476 TaxID=3154258 RepID=UPI00331FB1E2